MSWAIEMNTSASHLPVPAAPPGASPAAPPGASPAAPPGLDPARPPELSSRPVTAELSSRPVTAELSSRPVTAVLSPVIGWPPYSSGPGSAPPQPRARSFPMPKTIGA